MPREKPNPFEAKLPPGWWVRPVAEGVLPNTWEVINEDDISIFFAQVDTMMPLERHLSYAWERYKAQGLK